MKVGNRSAHTLCRAVQAADAIRQGYPGSAERLRSQVAQLREGAELVLRGHLAAAQVKLNALEADLVESDLVHTQQRFQRAGQRRAPETPKSRWRPGWL